MNSKNTLLYIVNVDWFFVSHRLPIALNAVSVGYDVHIICNETVYKSHLESRGISVHSLKISRTGYNIFHEFISLYKMRKIIKKINPSIVHAITIKAILYSGLSIKSIPCNNISFVAAISGLGYVFSSSNISERIKKSLVSILYRVVFSLPSKRVIFQNTSDQKTLNSICHLDANDQVLIKGSGVDLEQFIATSEHTSPPIRIVMACRLLKDKGVKEFVESARLLRIQQPQIPLEFILAGDLDTENPNSITQSELDEWREEGIVNAIGMCTDIPALFSQSHIIVLPSYYGEGVPKVLIEAAACGRPIVTTDTPGCRDCIIDKKTGYLVPPRDAQQLAEKILKLALDEDKRKTMGKSGREYAERNFDIQSVIASHMDIYQSLLNRMLPPLG